MFVSDDVGEDIGTREAGIRDRMAARQGHVDSQYNFGVMYATGVGVPQDDAVAVKWYRKAAEQDRQLGRTGWRD